MTTGCTAVGERRSFTRKAWIEGRCLCPDCGALADVWVRATDLSPYAKVRAHKVPAGVVPEPYKASGGKSARHPDEPA